MPLGMSFQALCSPSIRDSQFNCMFRFTLDGRVFKTPVAKKSKDPRFTSVFEWVWHCDPSELGSKELTVDFGFLNKNKNVIVGMLAPPPQQCLTIYPREGHHRCSFYCHRTREVGARAVHFQKGKCGRH